VVNVQADLKLRLNVRNAAVRVYSGHLISTGEGQVAPRLPPYFDEEDLGDLTPGVAGVRIADTSGHVLDRLMLLPVGLVHHPDGPPPFGARLEFVGGASQWLLDLRSTVVETEERRGWRVLHWRQFAGFPLATPPEWAANDPRARWVPGQPTDQAGPSVLRGMVPISLSDVRDLSPHGGVVPRPTLASAIRLRCARGPFVFVEPVDWRRVIWDPEDPKRDAPWEAFRRADPHSIAPGDAARQLLPLTLRDLGLELLSACPSASSAVAADARVRWGVPHLDVWFRHALPPGINGVVPEKLVRVADGWAPMPPPSVTGGVPLPDLDGADAQLSHTSLTSLRHFDAGAIAAAVSPPSPGALDPTVREESKWFDLAFSGAMLGLKLNLRFRQPPSAGGNPVARWTLRNAQGGEDLKLCGVPVVARRVVAQNSAQGVASVELTLSVSPSTASADLVFAALSREMTLTLQQVGSTQALNVTSLSGVVALDAAQVATWGQVVTNARDPVLTGASGSVRWLEARQLSMELARVDANPVVPKLLLEQLWVCAELNGTQYLRRSTTTLTLEAQGSGVLATLLPSGGDLRIVLFPAVVPPKSALQLQLRHPLPAFTIVETAGFDGTLPLNKLDLELQDGAGTTFSIPPAWVREVGDRLYLTFASDSGLVYRNAARLCPDLDVTVVALTRLYVLLERGHDSLFVPQQGMIGYSCRSLFGADPPTSNNGGPLAQVSIVLPQPEQPGVPPSAHLELNGLWHADLPYVSTDTPAVPVAHGLDIACWDARIDLAHGAALGQFTWGLKKGEAHFPVFIQHTLQLASQLSFCAFQTARVRKAAVGAEFQLDLSGIFALQPGRATTLVLARERRPDLVIVEGQAGSLQRESALAFLPAALPPAGPGTPLSLKASDPNTIQAPDRFSVLESTEVVFPWASRTMRVDWTSVAALPQSLPQTAAFVQGLPLGATTQQCWTLAQNEEVAGDLAWMPSGAVSIRGIPVAAPATLPRLWVLDTHALKVLWTAPNATDTDNIKRARQILAAARWHESAVFEVYPLPAPQPPGQLPTSIWTLVPSPLLDETLELGFYTGRSVFPNTTPTPPCDLTQAQLPPGVFLDPSDAHEHSIPPRFGPFTGRAPTPAEGAETPSFLDLDLPFEANRAGPPNRNDHIVFSVVRDVPFEVDALATGGWQPFCNEALPLAPDTTQPTNSQLSAQVPELGRQMRYLPYSPRPGELMEWRFGLSFVTAGKKLMVAEERAFRVRTPPAEARVAVSGSRPFPRDLTVRWSDVPPPDQSPLEDGMRQRKIEWTRTHPESTPLTTLAPTLAVNTPGIPEFVEQRPGVITAFLSAPLLPPPNLPADKAPVVVLILTQTPLSGAPKDLPPALFTFSAGLAPTPLAPARAEVTHTFDIGASNYRWALRLEWYLAPTGTGGATSTDKLVPCNPPRPIRITNDPSFKVLSLSAVLRPPPTLIAVLRATEGLRVVGYGPDVKQDWYPEPDAGWLTWRIRGHLLDRVPAGPGPAVSYQVITIRGDGAWVSTP
jgi:hypothetical protein